MTVTWIESLATAVLADGLPGATAGLSSSAVGMSLLVPAALVLLATAFDLRKREIPDTISLLILAWAVAATAFGLHGSGWGPWLSLAGGFVLGLGLAAVFFWAGGLGGGDVKLLAALGAALGPWPLLVTLFYMAIAGGVFSLIAWFRGSREIPYVPAIAVGLIVFILTRGGLAYAVCG